MKTISSERLKYLKLLSSQYHSINSASMEIINLQAILHLPKGTEHFVSDIHGEFASFNHVLRNASGVIKSYIDEIFGNTLRETEKRSLATLIYYPERKLDLVEQAEEDMSDWYRTALYRLIQVCRRCSSKYTRSKVRRAMQKDFAYILEELLHENNEVINKRGYYNEIIDTIIKLDRARDFVIAISQVIHQLSIDRLHVIGDIYDRGPDADKILDTLQNYHSIDVQWGNHDIVWMGAAAGSEDCICNVIRVSARYNNLHVIEESYGINLVPLASFALEHYGNDECEKFMPEISSGRRIDNKETGLISKMHKAICVLQFKVEAATIKRHPEYKMDGRILLDKINFENNTVKIDGTEYALTDTSFPTIDPSAPLELTEAEKELLKKLKYSFRNSSKLQEHAKFLFNKGGMYKMFNSNLLFHGCIPMNEDGSFKCVSIQGKDYCGKKYLDKIERIVRDGYFSRWQSKVRNEGLDLMWYLWCGPESPLYGKDKMATFERYFTDDERLYAEKKDSYYNLRNEAEICGEIIADFGLDAEKAHIINGHVPVQVTKGESPIKADGKLFVIDGGFAKAYQHVTGIAGYTLIYNSRGVILAAHEPFQSALDAVESEKDIVSQTMIVEYNQMRITVGDTDNGEEIKNKINDLEDLLYAYRKGLILESE